MKAYSPPQIAVYIFAAIIMAIAFLSFLVQDQIYPDTISRNLLTTLTFTMAGGFLVFKASQWWGLEAPFRFILDIPNFRGRWEGWVRSQFVEDWRPLAMECEQHGDQVQTRTWSYFGSWSRSIVASILKDNATRRSEIISVNVGRTANPAHPDNKALYHLEMVKSGGNEYLQGGYISDRLRDEGGTRGTTAEIILMRTRELGFVSEETWGMPKPKSMEFKVPAGISDSQPRSRS